MKKNKLFHRRDPYLNNQLFFFDQLNQMIRKNCPVKKILKSIPFVFFSTVFVFGGLNSFSNFVLIASSIIFTAIYLIIVEKCVK